MTKKQFLPSQKLSSTSRRLMPTLGLKVNIEPLTAVDTESLIRTPTHMLLICTTTPELTTLETAALPVTSLIAKLTMYQNQR